jgi:hypothetical protein
MQINVLADISVLESRIKLLVPAFREQAMLALNWTIFNARDAQRAEMSSVFDRPTSFTLNQTNQVIRASADSLQAETKIRDDASSGVAPVNYLSPSIYGGQRKVKRFERVLQAHGLMPSGWISIPGNGAKLDAYGNMSRGQIMQILSVLLASESVAGHTSNITDRSRKRNKKPRDYFVSTPTLPSPRGVKGRLPYGVYQRLSNRRIVTILRFRKEHQYKVRFDYYGVAQAVFARDFEKSMRKAFDRVANRPP